MSCTFFNPTVVFTSAILLRVILFFYGLFQDAYSALPYTDVDYYVFTDAAKYVYAGASPYERETYRYTPLLAWMLVPTAFSNPIWFSFGKAVFAAADIVAGFLMYRLLRSPQGGAMSKDKALKFASFWLLNPMVATISTRGSSEGLLGVIVISILWAVCSQRIALAGILLGLAVHFKIYPFIYGVSIFWYLDRTATSSSSTKSSRIQTILINFFNVQRLTLLITSLATFNALNLSMYATYRQPFLQHTYLHHLTRIDHRHNFSPYNTLLHLKSASASTSGSLSNTDSFNNISNDSSTIQIERLAFVPQLLLSALLIPLALAKTSLPSTMLIQTFAFVAFNKVCTSQYFLWYIALLPFYLPDSSLLANPRLGLAIVGAWVGAQALWLWQGWRLEFMGDSVFVDGLVRRGGGLWVAGLVFLGVNCWILGIMVMDVGCSTKRQQARSKAVDGK